VSATEILDIDIKPRADKRGFVAKALLRGGASVFVFGKTADEASLRLLIRLGDVARSSP
jgi:hypothetical protein